MGMWKKFDSRITNTLSKFLWPRQEKKHMGEKVLVAKKKRTQSTYIWRK